ncbi:distal tail protein Dit [Jeotgalicoccus psychrophilus]|uniref:distal tail protein Dit n=1 Tax=Jeotgalicoccus psychrophilus TaxID=157228 RepID=UPI000408B5A0|nr:distal tail protein Dit [Jeotgalicoccus psychrophilus]
MFEVEYESPGQKTGELIISSPFSLLVDGRNIDSYYSNNDLRVETINVYGRQTNEYDIQTTTPAKYSGQMVLGKRMKAKNIQVVLFIEADEMGLIQAFMSDLNRRLRSANAIAFKDEPDLAYYAEFEGADVPQEGLKQEVTLNFLWHDPMKYKIEKRIDYVNAQRLVIDSVEPVHPVIELQFETGIKTWSMRNTSTGMNINYEHELISDRYQMDLEELYLTRSANEVDAMDGLKLDSDFEEFTIKNGDQIVVTPTPQSITIRYRGVSL